MKQLRRKCEQDGRRECRRGESQVDGLNLLARPQREILGRNYECEARGQRRKSKKKNR